MKIAHIVPFIGEEASGPSYSVPALCNALQKKGCEVVLYTLGPINMKNHFFKLKSFPRSTFPIHSLGRSPEMFKQLLIDSNDIDIIHNHSLWMAPNIYAGLVAKLKKIPLINAPRGTMSAKALSRSSWKKSIVKILGQNLALKQTNCFHVTAEHEYMDVKKLFLSHPISIIPNGVDIPSLINDEKKNKHRTLLFLGRIHPIKGIENLINAWGELEIHFKDWKLDILGIGNKEYLDKLIKLIRKKGLQRVVIKDPVYGADKHVIYQKANLYVLPSFSENFGMTVAESLANATPVITTNATPWKDLDIKNAGWCIDVGVKELKEVLEEALVKSTYDLSQMGVNGREWMKMNYSWDSIADEMVNTYKWILNKAEQPKCIKNE